MRKVRALSLLSGGLDSLLSICVLREQGIEVCGITFVSPFFGADNARNAAKNLGCEIIVIDITDEHLGLVKNPPHGYGKCMNPCIDCHAMMIRKAGETACDNGYDFIATGEVLGERPMSQNRQSLDLVASMSGFADILLRPLSAKLLEPTKPETEGLVDRERLLAIEGRSRRPQMALARQYGLKKYIQPAGGCLLTDPIFSSKLRTLLKRRPEADGFDVGLLTLGRQFVMPSGARLIVGRDEKENDDLLAYVEAAGRGVVFISDQVPGPTAFLDNAAYDEDVKLAAKICVGYSKHGGAEVGLIMRDQRGERSIVVAPSDKNEFEKFKA